MSRLRRIRHRLFPRETQEEPPPPDQLSHAKALLNELLSYLDDKTDIGLAVLHIADGFSLPEYAAHLGPTYHMYHFTAFVLLIAVQIPYGHEGHIKLA
jgi:hypothetical protein